MLDLVLFYEINLFWLIFTLKVGLGKGECFYNERNEQKKDCL